MIKDNFWCGMLPSIFLIMYLIMANNIKTRVIQSNSLSFDIKTIILRASQQTIMSFKISMFPNVISTKSYSLLCSLFLTQGTPHVYPCVSQAIGSYFLTRFSFFNPHAIHERKPWTEHYGWNRIWWWRLCGEDKKGESLTSTRHINRLWRCPLIDINVSE